MRNVVVTGLGFITSIGNDQDTVLKNLRELNHGIGLHPGLQSDDTPSKVAGLIKDFETPGYDAEDWTYPSDYTIRREILRGLSPQGLFALCSAHQAIKDAGLSNEEVSNTQTGIYTASAGSPGCLHHHMNRMNERGVMRCYPLAIVASIAGTLSFNLVAALKILGSSCGFTSACASSGHALGYAFDEISLGRQDRMLVVGAEDGNRESIIPFAGMRALTPNSDPNTASRPFDKNRDGFVCTGGATTMILEDEETAKKRGATIYGRFNGWAQASDGHNVAISHPEGDGLARAIELALKSTQVSAADIDYINAHATSTPIGDASEIHALQRIFNTKSGLKPAISSTKALTGHGLSLSSVMEAGFCALALKHGFMPGSANIETLAPEAEGLNIIRETQDVAPQTILSNSSGFGGANTALIFSKYGA